MRSTADLRHAVRTASETGAAFVPDVLVADDLAPVAGELASAELEPLEAEHGVARQEGSIFVLTGDFPGYPAVAGLRDTLAAAIRGTGSDIGGLDRWYPNEASIQRYDAGALGITPHLDRKRYRYLVAVVTVEGAAEFTLCANRDGDPLDVWQVSAGDLVLLRGPGLAGAEDGRPLHSVRGPAAGRRTSIGFRMDD
jgi:hypothetical protein